MESLHPATKSEAEGEEEEGVDSTAIAKTFQSSFSLPVLKRCEDEDLEEREKGREGKGRESPSSFFFLLLPSGYGYLPSFLSAPSVRFFLSFVSSL